MKGSPFDTFEFRDHLETTLAQAVKTYFAKETAEAAQRKKNILSHRVNHWYGESRGWTEEYALVVEHYRTFNGGSRCACRCS